MKPLTLLALSPLALVLAGAPAFADDLSGPMVLKADFGRSAKYTFLCVPETRDGAISGPCVNTKSKIMAADGAFDGKSMRFKFFTNYNGSGLQLDFRGSARPDGSVSGAVTNRLSSGTFTAAAMGAQRSDAWKLWRVEVAIADGPSYSVVCAFKTNGTKMSGSCAYPEGSVLETSGKIDGFKVSLNYDADVAGRTVNVVYDGVLASNGSLSGTVKSGADSGAFTAVPAPAR